LFPRAALVGLLAGLLAVAFRAALAAGDTLRNALLAWAHRAPQWSWLLAVAFGMAGATLPMALVRHYAPETSGSGIPPGLMQLAGQSLGSSRPSQTVSSDCRRANRRNATAHRRRRLNHDPGGL
jgi:H+/Cl- antiporter ClcA